jgi:outer membrane protein, heavy metal efflux system
MGPGPLFAKHLVTLAGLSMAAALAFSGCTGTETRNETAARQDLVATQAHYRPHDAKPPLPVLSEQSDLKELITYALLNNPRVEAAYYDWAGAVEEITTARSLPDPMLNFGLDIGKGASALSVGLMSDPGMNWPGPGKLPLKAEAAFGEVLKRRALFEDELLATALAVKRAYYQTWVLEEQIRWTREILAVVDEIESLARRRLVVGKTTQQDVLRAQIERDQLRNELANLEDSRGTLEARMRTALGMGPATSLPKLAVKLDPTSAGLTEPALLDAAMERNPRLKSMRAEVLQAVALLGLARKTTVPDYSWGVGLSGPPAMISPSFGITLPIWRDKIAAEIARGQRGTGAAEARLSAEQLDLAVRFAETAYAWREADRAAALYSRDLIPKAQAALDSARAGYVGGLSTFADLLEAERLLLGYRLELAAAQGRRELALAEMSLVILGRWPEDVGRLLPEEAPAGIDK